MATGMRTYLAIMVLILSTPTLLYGQKKDSVEVREMIRRSRTTLNPDSAVSYAQSALDMARTSGSDWNEIESKDALADALIRSGNEYDGLRQYFQLIDLLERKENPEYLHQIYMDLGALFYRENLFSNAQEYYRLAYQQVREGKVKKDPVPLLMILGEITRKREDNDQSIRYLRQADSLIQGGFSNADPLPVLREKVETFYSSGDLEESLDINERILVILEERKDRRALAQQYNNLGVNYQQLGRIDDAAESFQKALQTHRQYRVFNSKEELTLLVNLGIIYFNRQDLKAATRYLDEAENLARKSHEMETLGEILDLKALLFLSANEPAKARKLNQQTLEISRKENIPVLRQNAYYTSSLISESLLNYEKALEDYKKHLDIKDSLELEERLRQERLLQNQYQVERAEKEIRLLIASNEIKETRIKQLQLENENKDILLENQQLEAREKLQSLRLKQQELENEKRERELRFIKAREENQRLLLQQKELEEQNRIREVELLKQTTRNQELELEQAETERRGLYVTAGLSILIALIVIIGLVFLTRTNRKLSESRKIIRQEKDRSDALLLNILPQATAEELKHHGRATPRRFENSTILFADFKGFTRFGEELEPEQLLDTLHQFFSTFDRLSEKHGIEKIKTIGDAYMCAGGVPIEDPDHAIRVTRCALEMVVAAERINQELKGMGLSPWNLRIGINSGPVVAGVVGDKKFAFDIWGDAVNTAARMEQNGIPGKINISESTYQLVKDQFSCTYRGEISVKNKGSIPMYILDPESNPLVQ
ncbi:MAG: tetratricopeptide repeat protein [Bacteroidota bacterium]|nr:tetratricopeptide repeat protein [Bacteroidota bacterium]